MEIADPVVESGGKVIFPSLVALEPKNYFTHEVYKISCDCMENRLSVITKNHY